MADMQNWMNDVMWTGLCNCVFLLYGHKNCVEMELSVAVQEHHWTC